MKFCNSMSIKKRRMTLAAALIAAPFLLAGCDNGGSSSSTTAMGTFSLAVTDGPIDSATKVVVEFNGVSIKPAVGEVIEFMFDEPKSIDLLQLQGSLSDGLVSGASVPAGAYEWIRLHVSAEEDTVMDSYLELNDGTQQELRIPSGAETGLKLVSGFTVPAGGSADFTVDFDLRKSITNPGGMPAAILKPALRLVDNVQVGSITGTVDADLVNTACADPNLDDGSVYVYAGADVTPVDIQGAATDPVITALVNVVDGEYSYEVGFLVEGDYTVAYTCAAAGDDPAAVNAIEFVQSATVPVLAGLPTGFDLTVDATAEVTVE